MPCDPGTAGSGPEPSGGAYRLSRRHAAVVFLAQRLLVGGCSDDIAIGIAPCLAGMVAEPGTGVGGDRTQDFRAADLGVMICGALRGTRLRWVGTDLRIG